MKHKIQIILPFLLLLFQNMVAQDVDINLTPSGTKEICQGVYTDVGSIEIREKNSDKDAFTPDALNTITLDMPSNFELEANTGSVVFESGKDITILTFTIATDKITIQFQTDDTGNERDRITISGIKVIANTVSTGNDMVAGTTTPSAISGLDTETIMTFDGLSTPSAPTISATNSYCVGQDLTSESLTATGSESIFTWYTDAALTSSIMGANTATINLTGTNSLNIDNSTISTTTFYVTQTASNGCESPATSFSVVLNPSPTVFITSDDVDNEVCVGESVIFTALGSTGTTFQFQVDGSNVTATEGTTTATTFTTSTSLVAGSYNVTVIGTKDGCSTTSSTISLTISDGTGTDIITYPTTPIGTTSADRTLEGSPAGGTFSGTGVVLLPSGDYVFRASLAGIGTHPITYTYCTGTDTENVEVQEDGCLDFVNASSGADIPDLSICDTDPNPELRIKESYWQNFNPWVQAIPNRSFNNDLDDWWVSHVVDINTGDILYDIPGNEWEFNPYGLSDPSLTSGSVPTDGTEIIDRLDIRVESDDPSLCSTGATRHRALEPRFSLDLSQIPGPFPRTLRFTVWGRFKESSLCDNDGSYMEYHDYWWHTITINPTPTASFSFPGSDNTFCVSDAPVTLDAIADAVPILASASGVEFKYTGISPVVPEQTLANGEIVPSSLTAGTYELTMTYTNSSGCAITTPAQTFIINDLPTANILDASDVIIASDIACSGEIKTYKADASGSDFTWIVTNGFITSGFGTNEIQVQWSSAGSGTLELTQSNTSTGCSETKSINVTINALPSPNIAGNASVCDSDANESYNTASTGTSSYSWSVVGGTIQGGTGSGTMADPSIISGITYDAIMVDWGNTGSGEITLIETNTTTNCTQTDFHSVSINPLPTPDITSADEPDFELCSEEQGITFSVIPVLGNSYSWTITGSNPAPGNTGTGANYTVNFDPVTTTQTLTASLTQTVSATGCEFTDIQNIIIHPRPTPNITGATSVCALTTGEVYTTALNAGNTYFWQVTGGVIVSGQNTNSITVNWGSTAGTQQVLVRETIHYPSGTTSCMQENTLSVEVLPLPTPDITGDNDVCSLTTGEIYQTTFNTNHQYDWQVTGGVIQGAGVVTTGSGTIFSPHVSTRSGVGAGNNEIVVDWDDTTPIDIVQTITVIETNLNQTPSCVNTDILNVKVNPLPEPSVLGPNVACAFDQDVSYSTVPLSGRTYNWSVSGGTFVSDAASPHIILVDWGTSGMGEITLTETITATGCTKTVSSTINIEEAPNDADFTYINQCLGETTEFTVTATGITPTWQFIWSFGDGFTQTTTSPTITYQYSNYNPDFAYNVTLTVVNDFNCTKTITKPLKINPVPVANFDFIGSCETNVTDFMDLSTVSTPDNIVAWQWDFEGDGTIDATTQNPSFTYPGIGVYNPTLTIITDGDDGHNHPTLGTPVQGLGTLANCSHTISKQIIIYPKEEPTAVNPYYEDFNMNDGGWNHTSEPTSPSSWEYGIPTDIPDSRGGVWATKIDGEYNNNEQSRLETTCFDLSGLDKPMLTFRYWHDFDAEDGLAVMISYDDGRTWNLLGDIDEGVNWINDEGIFSQPGGQIKGWSGNSEGWKVARFNLDDVKTTAGTDPIRFRFAFASNGAGRRNGYALDEVFVGSRDRKVLLEHFTNQNDANLATQLAEIETFPDDEAIKLQYHTAHNGEDPINSDNPSDPSARALFHGIGSTPKTVLDSYQEQEVFSSWGRDYYNDRILFPARFEIDVNFPDDGTDSLSIEANITALDTLTNPSLVHIVVIEREISGVVSGVPIIRNVVRKMLPNATGNYFDRTWEIGDLETLSHKILLYTGEINTLLGTKIYDANQVAVVVFVEDYITKEVYQSGMFTPPSAPNLATSLEDELNAKLWIYPNPANAQVYVGFEKIVEQDYEWRLMDALGRKVTGGTLKQGNNGFYIDTRNFAEGMYLFELGNRKNKIAKKIAIKH